MKNSRSGRQQGPRNTRREEGGRGPKGKPRRPDEKPRRPDEKPRRSDDRPQRSEDRPRRAEKPRPRQDDRPRGEPRPESRPDARPQQKRGGGDDFLRMQRRLFGHHAVAAAWMNPERRCRRVWASEEAMTAFGPVLEEARKAGLNRPEPIHADKEAMSRLVPPGAVHQGLILECEPLSEPALAAAASTSDLLVMLDQVTDPHNIGAVLRSAAAFGAGGLILQDRHTPEISGTMAKSASGAVEVVPVLRLTNLSRAMEEVKKLGFWTVGFSEHAEMELGQAELPEKLVLVLGSEGKGMRPGVASHCDLVLRLPTRPPIASLNVSNAAAIALFEARRRKG
jgi:23S rRNA (guanosine2251-2'-O)-methyltransferase